MLLIYVCKPVYFSFNIYNPHSFKDLSVVAMSTTFPVLKFPSLTSVKLNHNMALNFFVSLILPTLGPDAGSYF